MDAMLTLGTKGNTTPKSLCKLMPKCLHKLDEVMKCIIILRMVMFHIKWCIKQKMFSMHSVPFVEKTSVGTLDNTKLI